MGAKRLPLSEQIILELHRSKKTKSWLCEQMHITRPTLDQRLEYDDWFICEIVKISRLLELK